jgi:heat shock protein HslJ
MTLAVAPAAVWLLCSCGAAPREPGGAQPEPVAAQRTGHRNAQYSLAGRSVRLVDGVAEAPAAPGSAANIVSRYFGNEVWRDLNRDGREDVVFLLTQQTGGSGTFYYAVAALDLPDGFRGSEGLWLGDRIAPQSTELGQGEIIIVNYADRAPGQSLAEAPSVGKSIWLKLDVESMRLGEVVQGFEGEADPARMRLDAKTWLWIRATLDDGTEVVPRKTDAFTLTFRTDGTFSATTDCNRMNGGYTTNERALSFGPTAATRMFCEGSQETTFAELLGATSSYSFTSRGELVLQSNGSKAVFR